MKRLLPQSTWFLVPAVLLTLGTFSLWQAGEPDPAAFAKWPPKRLVPEEFCEVCHAKDSNGNQTAVLKEGPHAKAFASLSTEKGKEIAAKMGVADPAKSGKCLKCHATAYGFTEKKVTKEIKPEEGVTCQACHGPGDKYMDKDTHANNRDKALKKGLVVPTAANTCLRCHNAQNPSHNPERYTTKDAKKVDFDFEQATEKIKHPVKK